MFFDATKHVHALAVVNPFASDPYDAVGSFGIQIALFLALLSCLRSLLPDHHDAERLNRFNLVSRGNLLLASAITLTLVADVVALARHTSSWRASRSGLLLLAATLFLFTLSAYELARAWIVFRSMNQSPSLRRVIAIILTVIASTVCLAVYPERWRSGIVGVLGTAILGMLLIFLQLGVIARAILRATDEPVHDLIDDVIALREWLKQWLPGLAPIYNTLDRLLRVRLPSSIAQRVNPRRFRWLLCLLTGAMIGLLSVIMEFLTERTPDVRRVFLLITIFMTIEAAGVTIAYALFGPPLSLFRNEGELLERIATSTD